MSLTTDVLEVIIDTSSILFGISNKKDAIDAAHAMFPSYPIIISEGVLRELGGISHNEGKRGKSAKTALELIRRKYKNIKVYDNNTNVDEWILGKAQSSDCIVITNDSALCKKLKARGTRCLKLAVSGMLR